MRTSLYCFCLLFAVARLLDAQTATGRLTGSVSDPEGLAVVDAKIAVKGEATGVSLTGSTNALGAFSFTDVPPGEYSIEVSAANFRRQLIRRFKVDVAKENVLPPVRLDLGPVTETVEVKAEVGQVQSTNAELAATVTMQQIQHLPLTERNPLSLIALEAGVVQNGRSPTVINGQRTSFSNVTLDGINIQDNYIRDNALDFLPNRLLVDEIGEFTITTQNGNASLGLGSSQVNFVTPSGTNNYHGSLYYFNRNNTFAANQWFNNKDGVQKPRLNLHQFGGTLGGPIVRNKLLFYSNYEKYRQRRQALDDTTILTATARTGVFTYRDAQNRVQRVNILSAAGVPLDPRLARLLQSVPGAENINNFRAGDSDPSLLRNTAGYSFNVRDNTDRDNVTSRLDYIRSERHLFSGTYRYNRELVDRSDIENGFHKVPVAQNDGHVHFLSVAWRWNPRPTWTNELRGGMNIAPGAFTSSEQVGNQLFDGFVFTNPVVGFRPQGRDTNTFNYMDNATWQRGRHSIKFGAQFQRLYVTTFDSDGLIPTYGIGFSPENETFLDASQFPGRISGADLDRANNLLASLGGIIGSASQSFNIKDRNSGFVPNQEYRRRYRLHNYSFYGQDTWKLNRKMTVNFGMRWEYAGRFDERDGLMLSPIFTSIGVPATLLSNATLDFAGAAAGRPVYPKDLNNFGPNIGIAWDPLGDGKTAIRAGYSINYVNDQVLLAAENATFQNHGLQAQLELDDLVTTMSGKLPAFTLPKFQVPRTAADNFDIDPTAALFAVDPRLRTPYVQQWTFGIQRQVTHNTVFEVRYAGNKGTKLLRGFDYNQVIIRQNGFLDDFLRARNNGFLAQARTGTFNPAFNASIPGSQQLTVFPQ
ncbi:MAG: TonB-dependent receptor, partial [Acidobacteria bacterium]|nr:TonB-dependent receptor [Acidobacteriota bacterium]